MNFNRFRLSFLSAVGTLLACAPIGAAGEKSDAPKAPAAPTAPGATAPTAEPAPAGKPITVKGMLYSGRELIPHTELVIVGGKTSIEVASKFGLMVKGFRDNRTSRKKFDDLKDAWDAERKQLISTYIQPTTAVTTVKDGVPTTVYIPNGPSLQEMLNQTDAKYQPLLAQCQADGKAAIANFYETYDALVSDMKSPILGAGGNPDVILIKTDIGGKFSLTVPGIGRYYVVVLNPVIQRRNNVKNYVVMTVDIGRETKEIVLRNTDFVFD